MFQTVFCHFFGGTGGAGGARGGTAFFTLPAGRGSAGGCGGAIFNPSLI